MENIFPLLIAVVVVIGFIAILLVISSKKGRRIESASVKKETAPVKTKNRNQIIRDATRKLSQDAHNIEALTALGDVYFKERLWDKAYPIYDTMWKIAGAHPEVDLFLASLRTGMCAAKINKPQEALTALTYAYRLNPHDFDVNYAIGLACFQNKEYEKAIPCLKKALVVNNDAEGLFFLLGQCYYNAHHYHECLPCFKKALDEDPQNKEALYDMADAMTEDGFGDKAMKVFMHLRPDPVFGARSCLAAGMIHSRNGDNEVAIQDFEIGLKHENTPTETKLEIQYRLAQCYFSTNQIARGLQELRKVQTVNPTYKDVAVLLARYQELSQNANLQTYLIAGTSDFVALCRKVVICMYREATVKIQDINVGPVFTDILASVDSAKWEDVEVFRFFRTTGSTGEIYLRDFHGHLHDIKADRGFCITAGSFTDEARKFVEGRPIDLIEKATLVNMLKKVD